MMNDERLTIGQMVEFTGLSAHTLRFYERVGLLWEVERTESGRRRYRVWHIGWLHFVTRMRTSGMPIPEIQRYAEMLADGDLTAKERLQLLEDHRRSIEKQIRALQRNLSFIKDKIAYYKAIHWPDLEIDRPLTPWRVHLDPDRPCQRLDELPAPLAGYLSARRFQEGLAFLGRDDTGWDWERKFSFLQEACTLYRGFPDLEWNPFDIRAQADVVAFRVAPTGTHTGILRVALNGHRQRIPPTGAPLDIGEGELVARLDDASIVELNAYFDHDFETFITQLIEVAAVP